MWGAWCVRGCGVYGRGVGGWVWLRMWCVGRARGGGDSHSQAKDNAVCVCVCVWGSGGSVWRVWAGCVRAGGMCARVCVCVCVRARARACAWRRGGGAPGCVCVCTRWVQAGCVCGYACGVFLWVVRAETEAESRSQAKDDAVGVWYGHGVCVCGGGGVVCVWCVWWAGRDRSSQAKDHVHGWISRIICLCFLSSFSTSAIKTTPVKCESAPTSQHLSLARQTGECSELGGGGGVRDLLSPGQVESSRSAPEPDWSKWIRVICRGSV